MATFEESSSTSFVDSSVGCTNGPTVEVGASAEVSDDMWNVCGGGGTAKVFFLNL